MKFSLISVLRGSGFLTLGSEAVALKIQYLTFVFSALSIPILVIAVSIGLILEAEFSRHGVATFRVVFSRLYIMQRDDPVLLPVGTEVSAKYKGAFCEAKIRKVARNVKAVVALKSGGTSHTLNEENIRGKLLVGEEVQVKLPNQKDWTDGTITKLKDCSVYTVVFDDGDINSLRRSALCLKSGRHFAEGETLDQLPLTHPEHFGTPVQSASTRRSRRPEPEPPSSSSDSSSEDDERGQSYPKKAPSVGQVVCIVLGDKKRQKDNWIPGLVVAPTAQDTVKIKVSSECLVRSFQDGRYYTVPNKEIQRFSREVGEKVETSTLKAAVEKALLYLDKDELPPHWDRDVLFGKDMISDRDSSNSDVSDNESREQKDYFIAQLIKYMDDRGTPMNKPPMIGSMDLDLHRLYKIVKKLGGFNRVNNNSQWRQVHESMGFPSSSSASGVTQIKQAYKRHLKGFEEFNRKLGCTLASPRGRRNSSARSLVRGAEKSRGLFAAKAAATPKQSKPEPTPVSTPAESETETPKVEAKKRGRKKLVDSKDSSREVSPQTRAGKKVEEERAKAEEEQKEEPVPPVVVKSQSRKSSVASVSEDSKTPSSKKVDEKKTEVVEKKPEPVFEEPSLEPPRTPTRSEGREYFVHYTGWNVRWDEWVSRGQIIANFTHPFPNQSSAPRSARRGRSLGSRMEHEEIRLSARNKRESKEGTKESEPRSRSGTPSSVASAGSCGSAPQLTRSLSVSPSLDKPGKPASPAKKPAIPKPAKPAKDQKDNMTTPSKRDKPVSATSESPKVAKRLRVEEVSDKARRDILGLGAKGKNSADDVYEFDDAEELPDIKFAGRWAGKATPEKRPEMTAVVVKEEELPEVKPVVEQVANMGTMILSVAEHRPEAETKPTEVPTVIKPPVVPIPLNLTPATSAGPTPADPSPLPPPPPLPPQPAKKNLAKEPVPEKTSALKPNQVTPTPAPAVFKPPVIPTPVPEPTVEKKPNVEPVDNVWTLEAVPVDKEEKIQVALPISKPDSAAKPAKSKAISKPVAPEAVTLKPISVDAPVKPSEPEKTPPQKKQKKPKKPESPPDVAPIQQVEKEPAKLSPPEPPVRTLKPRAGPSFRATPVPRIESLMPVRRWPMHAKEIETGKDLMSEKKPKEDPVPKPLENVVRTRQFKVEPRVLRVEPPKEKKLREQKEKKPKEPIPSKAKEPSSSSAAAAVATPLILPPPQPPPPEIPITQEPKNPPKEPKNPPKEPKNPPKEPTVPEPPSKDPKPVEPVSAPDPPIAAAPKPEEPPKIQETPEEVTKEKSPPKDQPVKDSSSSKELVPEKTLEEPLQEKPVSEPTFRVLQPPEPVKETKKSSLLCLETIPLSPPPVLVKEESPPEVQQTLQVASQERTTSKDSVLRLPKPVKEKTPEVEDDRSKIIPRKRRFIKEEAEELKVKEPVPEKPQQQLSSPMMQQEQQQVSRKPKPMASLSPVVRLPMRREKPGLDSQKNSDDESESIDSNGSASKILARQRRVRPPASTLEILKKAFRKKSDFDAIFASNLLGPKQVDLRKVLVGYEHLFEPVDPSLSEEEFDSQLLKRLNEVKTVYQAMKTELLGIDKKIKGVLKQAGPE
ncbi:unnamed protein product [Notodromas monacha]|uniref:ARID domain-containing protein n=1 Tax=Notodromas monacha TaxID=399045 RepID=A0A7R9BRX6_9CRUS|nr:unnamed protein product [Notodromas monacha]CAG0920584.1 unnamed protein product [Notodromas monacha]